MMVLISKTFDFDAAHRLLSLPDTHKCHRLHGHTYRVEVRLRGELDEHGMVVDYARIAAAWQPVHDALDHRYLNEVPGLETPTTEVLAGWILARLRRDLPSMVAVRVYESASTYAEAMA